MNLLPSIQAHVRCRISQLRKDPRTPAQTITELQTVDDLCEAFNKQAHLFDNLTAQIFDHEHRTQTS